MQEARALEHRDAASVSSSSSSFARYSVAVGAGGVAEREGEREVGGGGRGGAKEGERGGGGGIGEGRGGEEGRGQWSPSPSVIGEGRGVRGEWSPSPSGTLGEFALAEQWEDGNTSLVVGNVEHQELGGSALSHRGQVSTRQRSTQQEYVEFVEAWLASSIGHGYGGVDDDDGVQKHKEEQYVERPIRFLQTEVSREVGFPNWYVALCVCVCVCVCVCINIHICVCVWCINTYDMYLRV